MYHTGENQIARLQSSPDTLATQAMENAGFVANYGAFDEFRSPQLYGQNPSNAELVTRYYQNVLHRAAEADGYNYWLGVLDRHLDTAAGVLANISESAENQAGVIGDR